MTAATEDDAIFERIDAWRAAGRRVALATVVRTWGSAPRRTGSHLALEEGGGFVGSVSGGCVEAEVVRQGREVCATGGPRLLEFTVSDSDAWQVGLACGGQVQIHLECPGPASAYAAVCAARAARRASVRVTRLADGVDALLDAAGHSGALALPAAALDEARARLARNESGVLACDPRLFARCYLPPPRLFVIGAVHVAQPLRTMARAVGFEVTIIDPRTAFAASQAFTATDVVEEWPDAALRRLAPDSGSAVVALTHDPKLDDPALAVALRSPAFYVGALGSRRTHAQRLERLAALGLAEESRRIHAPIGLDLGGRSAGEIAAAIIAEIIQVRYRAP
ncbi:MAG: XdhC family protein [Gammaproteobacteria bacterium]|nr:XdhC family protein [Gammaproteobacteria bacterium]